MKYRKMLAKLLGKVFAEKDNSVHLTEDDKQSLKVLLGETDAALLIEQVNAELSEVKTAKQELEGLKKSLQEKAKESDEKTAELEALTSKIEILIKQNKDLDEKVTKLSNEPETAIPVLHQMENVNVFAKKVFVQNGQLYGLQGKLWSTEAPWNAKAAEGAKGSTTDFRSSVVIERMNNDFLDYVRSYPEEIRSIFSNYFNLPEHWQVISGVLTEQITASVSVGTVTQARKARWAPKGDIVFKAESRKVYPTQIDLQFNYYELQKIETNWLNGFNREGSQAYKMSFISYLLVEFLKKARIEDADVLIRGIYVEVPEDREKDKPGHYLHRGNGLLKITFDAKLENKIRPFNIGMKWTFANSVDYIDEFIKQIPDVVRSSEPLQMLISPSKLLDYKRRSEQLFGGNSDYKGYPETPKDYPNIKFVPLQWFEGTDVIIVTTMDNIDILEFKPEEKSLLTIEKFLRDVYVFGDYRIGIGYKHIGLATVEGDPLALVKQIVWVNNEPLFSFNFFATSYDDKTGILKVNHNRIKPDVDFSTDIKEIRGDVGSILVIRGDVSMPSDVKIKHSTKIALEGNKDFKLKEGGDLTLIKLSDGTYKEVSRTSSPALEPTYKEFSTNALEYKADQYVYSGEEATLTKIDGGSEGNRLRITGGENGTLTIESVSGNIKVNSQAALSDASKFIDFIYVNNIWTEIDRG